MILLYIMNLFALIFIAVREVHRPSQALTWVMIGAVLPFVGPLMYFAMARPLRVKRKGVAPAAKSDLHLPDELPPSAYNIARTVSHMINLAPLRGEVQVLTNGREKFPALMKSLQSAKKSIDMEYFIFRDDDIGKTVMDILVERARKGVQIRLLVDGVGSRKLSKSAIQRLQQEDIECRRFFPITTQWLSPTLNHRDHNKIVVIDGREAYVGGINIGNEYLVGTPKFGPWRDTHIRLIGECVQQLSRVFEVNWQVGTPQHTGKPKTEPVRLRARRASSLVMGEWAAELLTDTDLPAHRSQARDPENRLVHAYMQTVESGPDREVPAIRNLFFLCLNQATSSIDITTPYFVPDGDILRALKMAIQRGVKVRLLIPKKPDHRIVELASRTYYEELLNSGLEIYHYEGGLLHAKVMVVDGEVSVVGAANFDLRSFRLNYEVSEVIYSRDIARQLTDQFERDLTKSVRLTLDEVRNKTSVQKFIDRGARVLSALI
jgi:phosphatidylserine/phosphatidylglycerophosphate/cardiolipin synthase-like enzyme